MAWPTHPAWLTNRRIKLLASLSVVIIFLVIAWQLVLIVVPLLTSIAVAALLMPLVRLGERSPLANRWPGIHRIAIAAVATFLAICLVLGLATLAVYGLVGGVTAFQEAAPDIFADTDAAWAQIKEDYRETVPESLQEVIDPRLEALRASMLDSGASALERVARIAQSSVSQVIVLLATPISVFQLLQRPGSLAEGTRRLLPELVRDDLSEMGRIAGNTVMAYIRIQLLSALLIGAAVWLLYWVSGVPLALPLGLLAAVTELVPVVGVSIYVLLAVVVVALLDLPKLPLALAIYVLLQVIQNGWLNPRLQGQALGVHPMALVLALALFGLWLDIIGALVAAPLTGAGWQVFQYLRREWRAG